MSQWVLVGLVAGLFNVVRGVDDLRKRRFVWGGVSLLLGAALLFAPIPTQAVKVEIPPASAANGG